jgi:hypothetical protein
MNFGPTSLPRDPELEREKAAARQDKIDAIREQSASLTDRLMRLFGARSSLFGGSSKPPIIGF